MNHGSQGLFWRARSRDAHREQQSACQWAALEQQRWKLGGFLPLPLARRTDGGAWVPECSWGSSSWTGAPPTAVGGD